MRVNGLTSRPDHFNPREEACGTRWVGDCVGPAAGLLRFATKTNFFASVVQGTTVSRLLGP